MITPCRTRDRLLRRALVLAAGREHLDAVADARDDGRTDEDRVIRLSAEGRDVDVRFEAVDLAAVGVAVHLDVDAPAASGTAGRWRAARA